MVADTQTQLKVLEWRQKAREGTLSMDEMREAIKFLRAGRAMTAPATGGSKTRKAAASAKPNGDDLLSELEGL